MCLASWNPRPSPIPTRIRLTLILLSIVAQAAVASAAPPVLTVPGPQTVVEGDPLAFQIQATDPDGQTVDLWAIALPPGAQFQDLRNNTGAFSWTPDFDQAGDHVATFLADDTFGGIDQKSVGITVLDLNLPPELGMIGDKSVERGTLLNVFLSAFDPESAPVTFSTVNLPPYGSLTDFQNGTANLAFSPGPQTPLGTTTMTVVVSDGSLSDSETFDVTVVASSAQSPPVLSAVGDPTVTEGTTASVDLSASDADGDALQWASTLPSFATLTPLTGGAGTATARLDIRPGFCDAGNHAANISVNDGTFSDFEAFTITVLDANRPPVWNVPSGGYHVTLASGASGSVALDAGDPDEACGAAAPILSVAGTTAGEALDATLDDSGDGSGTLHVTSLGPGGAFSVTVRATDRADASKFADASVAVLVEGTADAAVAARAWADQDPLRLQIGKPRHWVYLEPVEHSFALEAVVLESIELTAWEGSGTMESIRPVPGRFDRTGDRDNNGVRELRMDFLKEDLKALLANVSTPGAMRLVLHARLTDGRSLEVGLGWDVVPERERAIRRVGPNPLNPEATILVRAERDGTMTVRVFDPMGRLVRTVVESQSVSAGDHSVRFDGLDDAGRRLSSGRYFVRVDVAGVRDVEPLTIVK